MREFSKRNAVLFVALALSSPALAQFDAQHPPPEWMERGFEAAVADTRFVARRRKEQCFFEPR